MKDLRSKIMYRSSLEKKDGDILLMDDRRYRIDQDLRKRINLKNNMTLVIFIGLVLVHMNRTYKRLIVAKTSAGLDLFKIGLKEFAIVVVLALAEIYLVPRLVIPRDLSSYSIEVLEEEI